MRCKKKSKSKSEQKTAQALAMCLNLDKIRSGTCHRRMGKEDRSDSQRQVSRNQKKERDWCRTNRYWANRPKSVMVHAQKGLWEGNETNFSKELPLDSSPILPEWGCRKPPLPHLKLSRRIHADSAGVKRKLTTEVKDLEPNARAD